MKPHNLLFIFGFFYYLVTPPLVGLFGFFYTYPGMDFWHKDFKNITNQLSNYYLIILLFTFSYFFGSYFIKFLPRKESYLSINIEKKTIYILPIGVAAIFVIICFFLIIKNYDILFTGYSTYDVSFLGMLASLNSVSLVMILYFIITKSSRLVIYSFCIAILIISVILLGLGSRMYILIPLVALFVYKIYYSNSKWHLFKTTGLGIMALFFLLLIGSWRIGGVFDSDFLAYLLVSEPVFTWWSTSIFLFENSTFPFALPSNFITSFFNFIPSFLFENKSSLIISIKESFYYESPLGADSIFVNVMGNFGWFFGGFFFFFLGFFYSFIEDLSRKGGFYLAYYIAVVALIPFQVFRDNFSIIHKQLFWNMLIVPVFILITIYLITRLLPKKGL